MLLLVKSEIYLAIRTIYYSMITRINMIITRILNWTFRFCSENTGAVKNISEGPEVFDTSTGIKWVADNVSAEVNEASLIVQSQNPKVCLFFNPLHTGNCYINVHFFAWHARRLLSISWIFSLIFILESDCFRNLILLLCVMDCNSYLRHKKTLKICFLCIACLVMINFK